MACYAFIQKYTVKYSVIWKIAYDIVLNKKQYINMLLIL